MVRVPSSRRLENRPGAKLNGSGAAVMHDRCFLSGAIIVKALYADSPEIVPRDSGDVIEPVNREADREAVDTSSSASRPSARPRIRSRIRSRRPRRRRLPLPQPPTSRSHLFPRRRDRPARQRLPFQCLKTNCDPTQVRRYRSGLRTGAACAPSPSPRHEGRQDLPAGSELEG
jgi:hypothetical protein